MDSLKAENIELRKIKEKEFYDRVKNRTDLKKYGKLNYMSERKPKIRPLVVDGHYHSIDNYFDTIKFQEINRDSFNTYNEIKKVQGNFRNKVIQYDHKFMRSYNTSTISSLLQSPTSQ